MSKIIAKDHLKTQNWEITFEEIAHNYADLFIGFTDDAPIVEFTDLKFKYELKQGGNIKQYGMFPPPNTKYVRSDQEYLVVERLNLEMETDYELYLWAENNKNSIEKTVSFTTPRPAQPYASWTWDADGKKWVSPEPYPEDGQEYIWDEEAINWALVEETSV